MSTERVVVMASGGMDSTVLVYWALAQNLDVLPMFVNYGQHCAETELETVRSVLPQGIANSLALINISDVFRRSESRMIRSTDLWSEQIDSGNIMLPYRNLVLLATGSAFAASVNATSVMSAFINSNAATEIDATRSFLSDSSTLVSAVGGVKLSMPFRDMTKSQVAILGFKLGAPIASTYSCQVNAVEHCGSCPNCVERLTALAALRT